MNIVHVGASGKPCASDPLAQTFRVTLVLFNHGVEMSVEKERWRQRWPKFRYVRMWG